MFDATAVKYNSPTYGKLTFDEVIKKIQDYADPKIGEYEIIVGCDSQKHKHVLYIPAIVIRRVGNGGIYFYCKEIDRKRIDMATRLITETYYSVMVATVLRERLEPLGLGHLFKEVHADINLKNKSSKVAKTVTGMIMGYGFEAVIKPDGYVASYIADRHSKK